MYEIHHGAPQDQRAENETAVYRFLEQLNIPFLRIDHPPVHTMEDCQAVDEKLGGVICKSCFYATSRKPCFTC